MIFIYLSVLLSQTKLISIFVTHYDKNNPFLLSRKSIMLICVIPPLDISKLSSERTNLGDGSFMDLKAPNSLSITCSSDSKYATWIKHFLDQLLEQSTNKVFFFIANQIIAKPALHNTKTETTTIATTTPAESPPFLFDLYLVYINNKKMRNILKNIIFYK